MSPDMAARAPRGVTLRLRYFASLREALGEGEVFEAPAHVCTVAAVRDALIARGAPWAEALGRHRAVRAALNQVVCAEATPLAGDAELAFFPPVTGG